MHLECPSGYFGAGCMQQCLCINGAGCDGETGQCICTSGWTGVACEIGKNCQTHSPHMFGSTFMLHYFTISNAVLVSKTDTIVISLCINYNLFNYNFKGTDQAGTFMSL